MKPKKAKVTIAFRVDGSVKAELKTSAKKHKVTPSSRAEALVLEGLQREKEKAK